MVITCPSPKQQPPRQQLPRPVTPPHAFPFHSISASHLVPRHRPPPLSGHHVPLVPAASKHRQQGGGRILHGGRGRGRRLDCCGYHRCHLRSHTICGELGYGGLGLGGGEGGGGKGRGGGGRTEGPSKNRVYSVNRLYRSRGITRRSFTHLASRPPPAGAQI